MWDYLIYLYYHIDSTPLVLIWVVLLIECVFNKRVRGPNKVWWIIFILWTHIFGAALYFFLGPSQFYLTLLGKARANNQRPATPGPLYQPPTQPVPPGNTQTPSAPLKSYQQGYAAQPSLSEQLPQETRYADYEQPQASYPELTQEQ